MLKIKEIDVINGSTRYYISCDEKIQVNEKIYSKLVKIDTEELFCESTNIPGLFHFGCKQLKDSYDHKAGYVWSSSAGAMNNHFGTQLCDNCVVDCVGYWHLDINTLKTLVEEYTGKKYDIEQYFSPWDKNKEEPLYKLVEVE